jgi:hypothetical protein
MTTSRIEFFRHCVTACDAAAGSANDPAIKRAYLELGRAWQALADELEHLRSQNWHPKPYSGHALPHRSIEDFYEMRTAQSDKRAAKPAVEHPTLNRRDTAAGTGQDRLTPQGHRGRTKKADSA